MICPKYYQLTIFDIEFLKTLNRNNARLTSQYPEKVLQFGGGVFLRGFVDWMIDILNQNSDFNGSVVMVKPTPKGDYYQLREQQGLFHVMLEGTDNGKGLKEIHLVKCISRIIHAYQQWDEFMETATLPGLRFVVSNTTEAGITFDKNDQLAHSPPKEFPAKLTRWLFHRFNTFEGAEDKGCIILPCELIQGNGDQLQNCIIKYAKAWKLDPGFQNWITHHNYFCNTLVDRIVSGFPHDQAQEIQQKIGFNDSELVAAEWYHSWIIEGPRLLKDELPFEKTRLKIRLVDDITQYHDLKVRVLNGAHTSLVPVAYLCGFEMVHESFQDPLIRKFIECLLFDEVAVTVKLPPQQVQGFIQDVLERFRNPALKHQLLAIALNSTSKFSARLLPTLKDFINQNRVLPRHIVFSLAALLKFYQGSRQDQSIELRDGEETLEFFKNKWEAYHQQQITSNELVLSILSNSNIWGEDLTAVAGLSEAVRVCLLAIEIQGIHHCLEQIDTIPFTE